MPQQTISSIEVLSKKVNFSKNQHTERQEALKHYFSRGGIIRVNIEKQKQWPGLVYPTKLRLRALIRQREVLKANYLKKTRDWEKKLKDAEFYGIMHSVKRFSSPLYWKHKTKMISDSDYRKDAEKVDLPLHLVSDPRWQPMIRMFIEDLEYRKQLTETVENSIVYKKDKKLAKYATELQTFRKTESNRKLKDLGKKVADLDKDINTFKELVKWSNE